jgi:hypothetical protein
LQGIEGSGNILVHSTRHIARDRGIRTATEHIAGDRGGQEIYWYIPHDT